MYCSSCGNQNESDAKFCLSCGKPLSNSEQQALNTPPSIPSKTLEPGRGGLILTFGILSLVLLGPILGIPAWVMGHRDLKKIRAGIIAISQQGLTKSGMILGIIGTFLSPFAIIIVGIAITVGLSLFSAQSIQANRDAMIDDLSNIAANAHQYKIRPNSMGGGHGSYLGYKLPMRLQTNENAAYEVQVVSSDLVKFTAISRQNYLNSITVFLDSNGRLADWTYTGDFQ